MRYVIDNKGIDGESSYPYKALDGTCVYNASNSLANISKVLNVTQTDKSLTRCDFEPEGETLFGCKTRCNNSKRCSKTKLSSNNRTYSSNDPLWSFWEYSSWL